MRQRPGDQKLPVPNDQPDIQSQVVADIEQRRQLGIDRYGTALQPFNGRDVDQDAYEEAMDLTMYLKQRMIERTDDAMLANILRRSLTSPHVHVAIQPDYCVFDGSIALTEDEAELMRKVVENRG